MSSRAGPQAAGSDGTDFGHRERILSHYQTSSANKSRLRYVIYLHLLLVLLMLVRLTPSLLFLCSIPLPIFLQQLNLPPVMLWEYATLTSFIPDILGLLAIRRNKAFLLKQFVIGSLVFGLLPVLYGICYLVPDLLEYWNVRDTKNRFLGFPVVLLWNMFLIIAVQLHGIALVLAWTLWHAWTPKKKAA